MLRNYQIKAIELIRKEYQNNKRKCLLWLATGSGKTVIFSYIIKSASEKGKKCVVLVRGRKLVDQASQRLFRENVPHGVLMNQHWNYRPQLPIQICSIDTLISRKLRPPADIIIIDECHMAMSKGYREFLKDYPKSYILSVTATPYCNTDMRHIAETVVHPITMDELIEQKYLVPFRSFAPRVPDLTDVKTSAATKDYVNDQLEAAMTKGSLTGDIISHYQKIIVDKPTLLFAVNINHSKMLTQRFLMAGIAAEHCDADCSDNKREAVIKRLESGEIKVVCNVGIFCTGIDIPCIGGIILARPTKSKNLYLQQIGRGTRPFPGKENCILLDNAGNIIRHGGNPTEEDEIRLDGKPLIQKHLAEARTCKKCFAIFKGIICHECGTQTERIITPPSETDENLVELEKTPATLFLVLLKKGKKNKYKPSWAMYQLIHRVGFAEAAKHLPNWFLDYYLKTHSYKPNTGTTEYPSEHTDNKDQEPLKPRR